MLLVFFLRGSYTRQIVTVTWNISIMKRLSTELLKFMMPMKNLYVVTINNVNKVLESSEEFSVLMGHLKSELFR